MDLRIVRPLDIEREIEDVAFERRLAALAAALPQLRVLGGGAAGAWTFTNATRTKLLDGTFDIDSDSWKIALLTSSSNIGASSTTHAEVTGEVENGDGYTTGGESTTLSLSGTTTVTVAFTEVSWEADGGDITARFAELYEVSGNVLAYCLLDETPADVTVTDGNTLTITAGNVLTLS